MKNFFDQHKMIVICVASVIIGFIALVVFKLPFFTLFLLACPLMHLLMMSSGEHKH